MRHFSFLTIGTLIGALGGLVMGPVIVLFWLPWVSPLYMPTAGALIGFVLGLLTDLYANRGLDE